MFYILHYNVHLGSSNNSIIIFKTYGFERFAYNNFKEIEGSSSEEKL